MKKTLSSLFLTAVLLVATPAAFGQSFGATGTTNVTVTVAAEAAISVNSASPLASAGTLFADYTGSTSFTYKVRTKASGGSGAITAQVTTDFGAGGPSVATSGTTGNTLSYGCSLAGVGTACAGSVTASTTAATSVANFGENARSAKVGDTGSLAWVLVNDPRYQTGSYTAVVTLSISAL